MNKRLKFLQIYSFEWLYYEYSVIKINFKNWNSITVLNVKDSTNQTAFQIICYQLYDYFCRLWNVHLDTN